jgi:small neutral amino acid transporter SnatA (MarC family)
MTPLMRVLRAGATLVVALVFAFGVAAPPERCPTVTTAQLRGSAQAAVDWFDRNQHADGSWLYLYNADTDRATPEYNVVRHAGALMGLYQAAAAGLPNALQSADRGTGWALDRLTTRDDWSALLLGEIPTGATALLVAGLDIRREATGDRRYDPLLRRLGRFLVAQTEPSGAVLASYDPIRDRPVPGEYSKYYTGETYWALARLHLTFPREGWGEVADRIGAYLATKRDDVEDHWPPIEDHWAAYGLSETVRFPERGRPPLTADELGYARSQAELFGVETRYVSQRFGPWGAVVRGPHEPRGGGYGVLGEGLTGQWRTALADSRLADLRGPIAERATCMAGLAVDAQSDAKDAATAANPSRVEGAWFRDGETRMDDQQHALAALLRTVAIVRAGGGSDDAPRDETPPGWLWALVLLLALNPVRAAFGIPRGVTGGTPRESAGAIPRDSAAGAAHDPVEARSSAVALALLGGAAGAVLVLAVSAVAPALLDALDVSDSSFRVAAGAVAVGVGIADLFRRPPRPAPALPGRLAALVPVAVPLVARPALIVIALGAGADRGVLPSVAAMTIGVATIAALVATEPAGGTRDRSLRWIARLLAGALIAGGVAVTIAGILDV